MCLCLCVCILPSLSGMQILLFQRQIIFHLKPVWLYHVFPHYKRTIFGKNIEPKILFWFSLKIHPKNLSFLEELTYCHQCTYFFMLNTSYSCQTLTLEILYWCSKNAQISNFMEMCHMESELFYAGRDRRSDKYDETNCRFSQIFEHT
jgi:hypothetical protein